MWLETESVTESDFSSIYAALLPIKPLGNYKGYRLLVSVIEEILKQNAPHYNLTRDIYPSVALRYSCKDSSIERNLRTLLLNIDMAALKNFTDKYIPNRITVSQLIDILVVSFCK